MICGSQNRTPIVGLCTCEMSRDMISTIIYTIHTSSTLKYNFSSKNASLTKGKEVIGKSWKSGSCDWLARRANNLTSELQPQGESSSSLHPPSPLHTPYTPAMASRRLAFNLNQALKSRAALKSIQPVKRGFASPVTLPSTTQSTTLSNGFTVHADNPINPSQHY